VAGLFIESTLLYIAEVIERVQLYLYSFSGP